MAQIYSGTQCNVTWLGPSDDRTEDAFRLVERLSTSKLFDSDLNGEENLATAIGIVQAEFEVKETHLAWKALTSLFERHYWRRAWISQEVCLAPQTTTTCGRYKLPMSVIVSLDEQTFRPMSAISTKIRHDSQHKFLADRLSPFTASCLGIGALLSLSPTSGGQLEPLFYALQTLRPLQSSDPRDKLFAALWISENLEQITADYSRSADSVFREYAIKHMQRYSSLHLLGYCIYAPKTGYSTWAPEWAEQVVPFPLSSLLSVRVVEQPIFSAGGNSLPTPSFSNDHNVLVVQGISIDGLLFMASGYRTSRDRIKSHQTLTILHELTAGLMQYPDICRNVDRAGWQPSESGGYQQFETPVYRTTEESMLRAYERTWNADSAMNVYTGKLQRLGQPDGDNDGIMGTDRMFAVSFLGYFCLVPQEARLGDKIVVVKGGEVPLLLRPQQANFHLVGECYVHGIMDGEVMKIAMERDLLKEICIV